MLVTPITSKTPDGRDVSLTIGRHYEVLGIEADAYRVLTDEDTPHYPNEPVLYEPECFRIIDGAEPAFWISERGEEGERYAYPECWSRVGFFEDYFEGGERERVREEFWRELRELYPRTWEERRGSHLVSS